MKGKWLVLALGIVAGVVVAPFVRAKVPGAGLLPSVGR
jgi:hypothetical protein